MAEFLWWHRVGQKVVCVNDSRTRPEAGLVTGRVYTVAEVVSHPIEGVGFGLAETPFDIPNGTVEYGSGRYWCHGAWRFRPARETSIESLRALLNPTPAQKRAFFDEMIDEAEALHA